MNDDNRFQREDTLLDAYLNALWVDLNAEVPYGLDEEIAASVRALVESEVDLFGAKTPSQHTRIQIWNNALATAQKSQGKRKGKHLMNYPYVAKRGEKSPPKFLAIAALFIVAVFGVFLFSNRFNQPTPHPNPPQFGALQQFDAYALTATSIVSEATRAAYDPMALTATHMVAEALGLNMPVEQTANAILNDAQATVDALRQGGINGITPELLGASNQLVDSLFNGTARIHIIRQAILSGATELSGGRYIDITLTDGSTLLTRKRGDELLLYAFQLPTGLITYPNGSGGEGFYQQRGLLGEGEIIYINGNPVPDFFPTQVPQSLNFLPTIPSFSELTVTPTISPNVFPATATPLGGS